MVENILIKRKTTIFFPPKNMHPYGKRRILSKQMSACFGFFSHFKVFLLLERHTNVYDAKYFTQQNYSSTVYDCRTSVAPGFSQGYHVCQDHKQSNTLIPGNSPSPELFTSPNRHFKMSGRIAGMAAVES